MILTHTKPPQYFRSEQNNVIYTECLKKSTSLPTHEVDYKIMTIICCYCLSQLFQKALEIINECVPLEYISIVLAIKVLAQNNTTVTVVIVKQPQHPYVRFMILVSNLLSLSIGSSIGNNRSM